MNPTEPQQPPRTSTSCSLHPNDPHSTGFCPSCLFDRLSVLDQSANSSATAGRKSASSAIKSLFKNDRPSFRSKPGSSLPELRRTKSFSGGRNAGFSGVLEPQRRSCDVRARATLHSLFNQPATATAAAEQQEEEEENSGSAEQENIAVENTKKPSSGVSFWSKLTSWTRKSGKMKKGGGGGRSAAEKSKKSRETQSEVAEYGYGRRSCDTDPRVSIDVVGRMSLDYGYARRLSCDTDPRVSIDVGRMSVDDPRYSFDEQPRASCDGYLIGGRKLVPSMLSVVEGSPKIEEPRRSIGMVEEDGVPGGAAQTKDYYEDSSSSSRRRKSLDRSSSMRKTAAAVVAELDEMKSGGSNVEVGPNLVRDECSESFDFGDRDRKGAKKAKSWRSWNIWGLIVRRGGSKDENGVERAYSESWQEMGRDGYGGDPRVGYNRSSFRSSSSVRWRNSDKMGGPTGHAKKKSNEFVLERNRSARYSPNDVDNGMLRFYLAPMKGSRRGPMARAKPAAYSHTIARSALRTY